MAASRELPSPETNHLLATLPEDVKERLFPCLETVTLSLGQVLQQSGKTTRYAYFPATSIVSLVYELEDGHSAEISLVGNDGIVGIALFMGGQSAVGKGLVQVAGEAFRIKADLFLEEFERHAGLMHHVLLYTQALMTQMAQTAVCNRHHTVQQQLCRWLLITWPYRGHRPHQARAVELRMLCRGQKRDRPSVARPVVVTLLPSP